MAFITWSHHALIQGNRKGAIAGAFICITLAVIFTALQGYEYATAPFSIADSVFGTVFFASTGLHGAHVVVGSLFLIVAFFRIINYHYSTNHHVGYEASILYWQNKQKLNALYSVSYYRTSLIAEASRST